jgi:mannose-6-phosphate isomerase-like protein (cupin superfamily)
MLTQEQLQPLLLNQQQGRALWHLDALLVFKALGDETNGQFWAFEGLADQRMAVPLHSHSRDDEFWYVLEGDILFVIGERTFVAGAGTFAYVPRTVPHSFRVLSERARWFGAGTPAGFDQWFFETGVPAQSLELPPLATAPPDINALVTSLKASGTDTLGPPPSI